ncbi:hypothetical protein Bhyg_00878 [Pseudolycoriella hygida]|uniref:Uncharacterized protein n=1 Tax=Pseudolycoriella hygida TaxID=35572 RepID=A0A9Q0N8C4_9DIPT|nr:hypothetical protein Bhyg_00878 [Pseudolycoriella hygida]
MFAAYKYYTRLFGELQFSLPGSRLPPWFHFHLATGNCVCSNVCINFFAHMKFLEDTICECDLFKWDSVERALRKVDAVMTSGKYS